VGFLTGEASPGWSPGGKCFSGMKALEMIAVSISFGSFTAQIYNALHWQRNANGKFWHVGAWPACPPFLRNPAIRGYMYTIWTSTFFDPNTAVVLAFIIKNLS